MKRIKDLELLRGKTESMTMMEFRSGPGDAISKAEMGMIITITRNRNPVATLSPIEPDAIQLGRMLRQIPEDSAGTY